MALVFAVMHLYNIFIFYCFCPTTPACPRLMCFFNRGNTEGTSSLKFLCLMYVYVLCKFVSRLILCFVETLWFDGLFAESIEDIVKLVLALM